MGALLKKLDQVNVRYFYAGMIVLMLALFAWLAGSNLSKASVFLAVGVVYAVLVYRVVSQSVRAFTVMSWTFLLNYFTLISISVDGSLGIPSAGPWFIGFIIGAIAGGYVWLGPRAGSEFKHSRKRLPEPDGSFSGGWRLAVINGFCALVLLGFGTAQLLLLSPTAESAVVLAAAFMAGWTLFRFPPSLGIRNGLLILGLPVSYFVLGFVGGATDQIALPNAWAYGVLAGILIGGRYWTGPRIGQPRAPFNGPGRRRKRRLRSKPKQTHPM
ncbi:hypothetical protein H9638_09775 [Arthrobacter sp. Sa2BUA2]|uniref:Uncharacterized protein n=1 Tax=Arthrobacter pullicola TaxID=2762224 RepID=A0ABR8YIQ6_9MICC|nr:hypothetical protein [Arthrobacter pullicola]MBD8044095.1 hypothetical protein [Arthrobacter pullicola]